MLEATARNKPLSGRPYEDEMTSAVFSPWHYLPPTETWPLLLDCLDAPDELSRLRPTALSVDFWPRARISYRGRPCTVEPDALITVAFDGYPQIQVILEVKWSNQTGHSAPLSSKDRDGLYDQLARQWTAYGGADSWHLFLTPEPKSAEVEDCRQSLLRAYSPTAAADWQSRFRHLTWHTLAGLCDRVSNREASTASRWGSLVVGALNRLGIRRFSGFRGVDRSQFQIQPHPSPLLWQYFGDLPTWHTADQFFPTVDTPLFFRHSTGEAHE